MLSRWETDFTVERILGRKDFAKAAPAHHNKKREENNSNVDAAVDSLASLSLTGKKE